MLQLRITKTHLLIFRDYNDSPIYNIPLFTLGEILDIGGKNISDWIHQLYIKTWIENKTLYQIALLIQSTNIEHKIDWLATFYMVEKKDYLNHVRSIKELVEENPESKSYFDSVMAGIKIGIEENNPEINNEISELVKTKLKWYGIKFQE